MNQKRTISSFFSRGPAPVLFFALIIIFSTVVSNPSSFAQSCSITSMEKGKEIRACQIEDMRNLINQARAACALGAITPFTFSDEPIVPNRTAISIRHIHEFEKAIGEISTKCGTVRPLPIFKTIKDDGIISTSNYVSIYNDFVSTPFCGDAVCQIDYENLTTCAVDCGGESQFYCNGMGGCYAAISCPSGKNCYSFLQECLDHASSDCSSCVPDCTGKEMKTTCESWDDGCGGRCWGTEDVACECSKTTCVGSSCTDACGHVCAGTKFPNTSCASETCAGQTCSDGCGGVVVGTAASLCNCASETCTGTSCLDKCGVTCPGIKPPCSCASETCVGQTCSDDCGSGNCPGTKMPDCSGAVDSCWDDGVDDGCGGFCPGSNDCSVGVTKVCGAGQGLILRAQGNNPALDGYEYYRCNGDCIPNDSNKISPIVGNGVQWMDSTAVIGQTYTYAAKFHDKDKNAYSAMHGFKTITFSGPDCSCASDTWFDDACSDGCGGECLGVKTGGTRPYQNCGDNSAIYFDGVEGDFPTLQGYYIYRCAGNCVPTQADRISPLIGNGVAWADTNVSTGKTYTYSRKPHFSDRDPGIFSDPETITLGTAVKDCSCAVNTCVGSSCSDGCGGTCAGTKQASCACASNTCTGSVCSDGCGGTCPGSKDCDFQPIECKKWSCSNSGFCVQNYTQTCSCPEGLKPACYKSSPVSCGADTCPDTVCKCVS